MNGEVVTVFVEEGEEREPAPRLTEAALAPLRQNRPSLVVKDLEKHAPADEIYGALLRRGVFKWMSVRRGLIAAKDTWRHEITASLIRQAGFKGMRKAVPRRMHRLRRELGLKIAEERGYRRALEACRATVRTLCHSPRLQAPENDRAAQRWLAGNIKRCPS